MAHASLRLTGLSKRFGDTRALTDVSLEVRPGEVLGYLGPNGAGKTTTIRLVMGMLRPTAGRAEVGGLDCWRDPVAAHRLVGYVPGDAATYPRLTGRQHVDYFASLRHAAPDGGASSPSSRPGPARWRSGSTST